MFSYVGGGAALTALGLAKLGLKVDFEGVIADDLYGNYIFKETDDNGIVVVPKGYRIVTHQFGFNLPKKPKLNLKGGCYYQFAELYCIPEIFENRKIKIQGDTLIMITKHKVRGRRNGQKREYYIFKNKYIKIQNEH